MRKAGRGPARARAHRRHLVPKLWAAALLAGPRTAATLRVTKLGEEGSSAETDVFGDPVAGPSPGLAGSLGGSSVLSEEERAAAAAGLTPMADDVDARVRFAQDSAGVYMAPNTDLSSMGVVPGPGIYAPYSLGYDRVDTGGLGLLLPMHGGIPRGVGPTSAPVRQPTGPVAAAMATAMARAKAAFRMAAPQLQERPRSRWEPLFMAVVGGTGVLSSEDAPPILRRDLDLRARCQGGALLILLVAAYFTALFAGLSYLRWRSENSSPITYYADPRQSTAVMEGHEIASFLAAFNVPPNGVQLQVTGLLPASASAAGTMYWVDEEYYVAFTFALDLSVWLVRQEWAPGGAEALHDGVAVPELTRLRSFLESNRNDMATVVLQKEVTWPSWEELATNVKQRIRQQGFAGEIAVHLHGSEQVAVHKNKPWANFMHNRFTRLLTACSGLGWAVYAAYMSWRCTQLRIHAHYRVDITPEAYWELVTDKLGAGGFDAGAGRAA